MKKVVIVAILMVSMVLGLCGCGNYDVMDTVRRYDYAIVSFPDGTVQHIDVKQWCDYDGEQLQITATDDKVYLVNSVNCVLVRE